MGWEEEDRGFNFACFCEWFEDFVPNVERFLDGGVACFPRKLVHLGYLGQFCAI